MNIIITGRSGFVGTNLATYLKEKQIKVENISLRSSDWVLNSAATAIIHLAGKAHDTSNSSLKDEYFKINTDLTKDLFDKFLTTNIRDFFYFSSVKATADTIEGILDESHHSNPKTPYGKSKLSAEEYLLNHNLPAGKRLFIIRPCMIHGPENKGNLNLLFNIIEKGIPWPLGAFHNTRSFLSIDNLNYLIYKMLDSELPSGIYNFADDESVSTNELVKIIAKSTGKKDLIWKIPTSLISGLASIGDVIRLPLNSERLKKLTESYIVSNKKIKQALIIENLPMSAAEGLKKTIKSFKK